ncbi:transcription factor Dp-like isoform X1 [Drosophila miranda]|uniref:transcription factor Dp-like isoform X1 n=1 Tax=Drosophila miranda TaxID=7229 RepID=UPI00143F63BC|nr:transcription factor Dp-like isoform X1 [Drosophila miranda]XP_033251143.1 transcription factor Dp-like isoform X1 [Drosophila miranda]
MPVVKPLCASFEGQIATMRKPAQVKSEMHSGKSSVVYATSSSARNSVSGIGTVGRIGAFSQMCSTNQGQFIRLQDNGTVIPKTENTSYTTGSAQKSASGGGGMYDVIKERFERFTPNNPIKMKSRLHAIQSNHSTSASSSSEQRKRKPDKAGKGLRHFSMKVCEKVEEKGKTTYNEVADDLVSEEMKNNAYDSNCDQKNIRRRVYDALNVLMAINVISKDKKEIRWIGLPANSAEQFLALEEENSLRRERIKQKNDMLREMIMQHVAFKGLVERNKRNESQGVVPSANASCQLPFIIVNTHKSTKINCSVTNDKSEYIFKFDKTFEMHDDIEVLKRMGFCLGLDKGKCMPEKIERVKNWVPPNLAKYVEAYGAGKTGETMYDSDDEDTEFTVYNDSQSLSQNTTQRTIGDGLKLELDDDELEDDID